MLLKLHDSQLFTTDTADRFAREYNVRKELWYGIWERHLAGVDDECLAGYLLYKTNVRISLKALRRWLARTQVYCRANQVMVMGVRVVQSEFFGVYEEFTVKEVLKNMRFSGAQDSRTVV